MLWIWSRNWEKLRKGILLVQKVSRNRTCSSSIQSWENDPRWKRLWGWSGVIFSLGVKVYKPRREVVAKIKTFLLKNIKENFNMEGVYCCLIFEDVVTFGFLFFFSSSFFFILNFFFLLKRILFVSVVEQKELILNLAKKLSDKDIV